MLFPEGVNNLPLGITVSPDWSIETKRSPAGAEAIHGSASFLFELQEVNMVRMRRQADRHFIMINLIISESEKLTPLNLQPVIYNIIIN